MILLKQQTKILQGIAILCMVGLHLFNRDNIGDFYDLYLSIPIEGGCISLLTLISYSFDACVPIYLFCSDMGYIRNFLIQMNI